jgi:hypothetical protein
MANFNLTLPSGDGPEPQNEIFSISNQTAFQTLLLFDTILPAFVTSDNDSSSSSSQLKWLNGGGFLGTPPQLVPLPNAVNPWIPPNNISAHMEKLAKVMTIVMRNTPSQNNTLQQANGVAWEQRTFVKTRWLWLILPLTLLTFSLIFLMATVAKSSREESQVGIWKTSIIAVLFNGLGEEVQKKVAPNCRMGEARDVARQLRVRLCPW